MKVSEQIMKSDFITYHSTLRTSWVFLGHSFHTLGAAINPNHLEGTLQYSISQAMALHVCPKLPLVDKNRSMRFLA